MSRFRILALVLLLLVCAVSFWLAQGAGWYGRPPGSIDSARDEAAVGSTVPAQTIRLKVLNGSGVPGLARRFSRQLAIFGCVIVSIADAPHDSFTSSILINRRLSPATAGQLASRLNGVHTILERDPRSQEDAVLVLGHDHHRLLEETQTQR